MGKRQLKRVIILMGCLAFLVGFRSDKPITLTDLDDTNQLTELNNTLQDTWNITNGRFTLDSITANPSGSRKGTRGDLVYATYSGTKYLCVNDSDPSPGTTWTCLNTSAGASPGGSDTQVQYNDGGAFGGDAGFVFSESLDHSGLGPSAAVDQTFAVPNSGSRNSTQILNARETISAVAASGAEANGIIGQITYNPSSDESGFIFGVQGAAIIPSSNAVSFTDAEDKLIGIQGVVSYEGTGTAGVGTVITGVRGEAYHGGTGDVRWSTGGTFYNANTSTGTLTSAYGVLVRGVDNTGGGTLTNANGVYIETQDAASSKNYGIYVEGSQTDSPPSMNIFGNYSLFGTDPGDTTTSPGVVVIDPKDQTGSNISTEDRSVVNLVSANHIFRVGSGSTITAHRNNQFLAPTINGIAGGATETITGAAVIYVDDAPSGSNITFVDTSSIWVDNGQTRLDGPVVIGAQETVTGQSIVWGHQHYGGTAPTLSSCGGGSPSIVGNDNAGKVTVGTGVVTSCTLTFNLAWEKAPACSANDETAILLTRATSTVSTLVLDAGSTFDEDVLSYQCTGVQ